MSPARSTLSEQQSAGYAPTTDVVERRTALRRMMRDRHDPVSEHQRLIGAEPADPALWQELARDVGVCAALVPEELGGLGLGHAELVMVAGELGAVLYGGPFWGTAVLGLPALLSVRESAHARDLVERAAAGKVRLGFAFRGTDAVLEETTAGATLSGRATLVVDAAETDVLCVLARAGDVPALVTMPRSSYRIEPLVSVDPTRPLHDVVFDAAPATVVATGLDATNAVAAAMTAARLAAAGEAVRGAEEALRLSVDYANHRTQFGRPIGVHQAIKHKCADGLIAIQLAKSALSYASAAVDDDVDEADAAVLAARIAATDAYVRVAADAIQIHGTYGYTRDAIPQSYYRRARWLSLYLGTAGDDLAPLGDAILSDVTTEGRALFGVRMPGPDAAGRDTVRGWLEAHPEPSPEELVDAGYMVPHWPPPYGLGADRDLLLIIEQELERAGVTRPPFPLARDFVAPLIAMSGSPEQQRFLRSMLTGDDIWCELFSEPEAGSDLASLATTAKRTETGYVVNGVKTWTSQAHLARYGLLLARTDPDAPKHRGISCFIVPMDAPGISQRPIESMEGERKWSTVYLDDVHLTLADRVGEENQGWKIALDVLANERLSMSSTPGLLWGEGPSFADLLVLLRSRDRQRPLPDYLRQRIARGYVEALALHVMRIEATGQQGYANAADRDVVPEVRRALADAHGQAMVELWRDVHGADGAVLEPPGECNEVWAASYFAARSLTLGGGTSEIQRNILAERVLGLPRS